MVGSVVNGCDDGNEYDVEDYGYSRYGVILVSVMYEYISIWGGWD